MTDQERLENIKKHHEYTIKKPFFTTTAHPTDVAWLIKRVQELEASVGSLSEESRANYEAAYQRGKDAQRYKQALETISNSDPRLIKNAANGCLTATELHIKCVEEADKALRGEAECE